MKAKRRLCIVAALVLVFMVAEVVGGICSHSLAILTDAAHLLADAFGIFISLIALTITSWRPSSRMSFGHHRTEILGALFSLLLIWGVTAALVVEATRRILYPSVVNGKLMLLVACVGVLMNVVMIAILHGGQCESMHHGCCHKHVHVAEGSAQYELVGNNSNVQELDHSEKGHSCCHNSHLHEHDADETSTDGHECLEDVSLCKASKTAMSMDGTDHDPGVKEGPREHKVQVNPTPQCDTKRNTNVNLRSVYLHVLGDLIQSVGVALASFVVYLNPSWSVIDPICTYIFSAVVLFTTRKLFHEVVGVLLERAPDSIDPDTMLTQLQSYHGVVSVSDLHVWAITFQHVALTANLKKAPGEDVHKVLEHARRVCRQHGIVHSTFEIV